MAIVTDQENNSTIGRGVVSGHAVGEGDIGGSDQKKASVASTAASNNANINNGQQGYYDTMDYVWMEPRHDPIATDTNLAEIDFENFKNEDLAYAFSCGEEESGGSSTDMSVCRSEPLFSSMRDSEMQSELNPSSDPKGAASAVNAAGLVVPPQDSLIQDSLTDEDFNFSEKVTVNKNNYTLTYSGQGVIGSFIASMVSSTGAMLGNPEQAEGSLALQTSSTHFHDRNLDSPGKLTTWSNLSRSPYQQSPPQPVIWQSRNREELNNNADNNESRKSKSLPDFELESGAKAEAAGRLVNAFIRGRNEKDSNDEIGIPMIRSKDTVNQYLKTNSRLTSIEENESPSSHSSSSEVISSGSTLRTTQSPKHAQQRPLTLPPKPQIKFLRKSKSLSTSHGAKNEPSTSSGNPSSKYTYPDLDFLENDLGLWDTFFSHGKNSSKFQSVLRPPLPIDEYLKKCNNETVEEEPEVKASIKVMTPKPIIHDTASLRALLPAAQKHLLPSKPETDFMASSDRPDVKLVKVKQAWTASPEAVTSVEVVRRRKKSEPSSERNLNLINNNNGSQSEATSASDLKRRSYHPQDYLSQVLEPPGEALRLRRRDFPKSGSQNDLVDSWRDEDEASSSQTTSEAVLAANARWNTQQQSSSAGSSRHLSAEYPFHKNLCMPPQGINFDLTHKRGLFVNLYSAVERLLLYHDDSTTSDTSVRYVLFHELCPALMAIMRDGLKPEVITSFGRMQTNVWRLIEALTRQGPSISAATSDLVMLLNAKFAAAGEEHRKFAGFIAGLLNMSSLHVWFSKLKWNMDVLLRFYERHAFICALHKETRLLFDELVFCLQRLYSVPIHFDLPFSSEILEDIPPLASTAASTPSTTSNTCTLHGCMGQKHAFDSNHCCCSNCFCNDSPASSGASVKVRRPQSASKSRIPRPISLPKRLESKLSASPSPVRGGGVTSALKVRASPTAAPVRPTTAAGDRKSRVRDTVKLFDTRNGNEVSHRRGTTATSAKRNSLKSPKTGAGEAMMALEDTGGHHEPVSKR